MSVIQQVYLAESGSSIYIKGIKPDKENEYSGEITLNGNPTRLERKERYHISNGMGLLGFDRRLQIIRTCRAQSL